MQSVPSGAAPDVAASSPPAPVSSPNSPTSPARAPLQQDPAMDDDDDPFGASDLESTASLSASILEYRTIHGRSFHSERTNAEYWGPNDARQQESMDIHHHVYTLLLDDQLFLAPLGKNIHKVLDVGTGTGIWAIDFADQYPGAAVIGTDLSPIQPAWVPPNLKFEMDDCTLPWTWGDDVFDFVHARALFGSIADWPALFGSAFRAVKPGGWFESLECSILCQADDGSIRPEDPLFGVMHQWGPTFIEAGAKMGRPLDIVDRGMTLRWAREAGFVDVQERRFKVPMGPWSADRRLREVGRFNQLAADEGLEGYALYLLTQVLGWSVDECTVFVAKTRRALRSKRNRAYFEVSVVYGRKPG